MCSHVFKDIQISKYIWHLVDLILFEIEIKREVYTYLSIRIQKIIAHCDIHFSCKVFWMFTSSIDSNYIYCHIMHVAYQLWSRRTCIFGLWFCTEIISIFTENSENCHTWEFAHRRKTHKTLIVAACGRKRIAMSIVAVFVCISAVTRIKYVHIKANRVRRTLAEHFRIGNRS